MRRIKIPKGKGRPKTIKCLRCHCMTLRLVKKAWEENPLMGCNELRGHYKCDNCGLTCSKSFANEKLKAKETVIVKSVNIIVICQVFNGCRCTICGGFFADGDDICVLSHEIGQQYIFSCRN